MDNLNKKCSFKDHQEVNANSYCRECKIFMCNKCEAHHSSLFLNHEQFNLIKNNEEIFTGFCSEKEHNNKLKFFCKNHNQLCCTACIAKIKDENYGNHKDCDVCSIKEIKEEKIKKLEENIQYLEDISKNINESINNLKNISEKINEKKEELKLNIQKIFTKLRNELNNREDVLLNEVDKQFENLFPKVEVIKEYEKLPNKIKLSLEKSKDINKNENKLYSFINECIKIENIISDINNIDKDLKNSKKLENKFVFNLDEKDISKFIENIKKFGELVDKDKKKNYINFREINKEVKIIENSIVYPGFDLDIMMERKQNSYSLFKGQNGNHFTIFDLNKKLYLKEILISVKQNNDCVLKHFKVSIKDEQENWIEVKEFCCQNNEYQIDMQRFSIEKETQFVKIDFIDAWGSYNGDYILIRRLKFNVADID